MYTQRDPIGLAGGNPTTYGYVFNTLKHIDPFGLRWVAPKGFQAHHIIPRSVWNKSTFLQNSGLGLNDASNRVDLPKVAGGDSLYPNSSTHNNFNKPHSNYNNIMEQRVQRLEARAKKNNWSQSKIQVEINKLQNRTRNELRKGTIRCG